MRNGRTLDGKVGAKVQPSGDNPRNQAWIIARMHQGSDVRGPVPKTYFLSYEVEYTEFKENYKEELHGYDWDQFLLKTETWHNIENEQELEQILLKYMADVKDLVPAANIVHPML